MFLPNVAKTGVLFQLFQDWEDIVFSRKSSQDTQFPESGLWALEVIDFK